MGNANDMLVYHIPYTHTQWKYSKGNRKTTLLSPSLLFLAMPISPSQIAESERGWESENNFQLSQFHVITYLIAFAREATKLSHGPVFLRHISREVVVVVVVVSVLFQITVCCHKGLLYYTRTLCQHTQCEWLCDTTRQKEAFMSIVAPLRWRSRLRDVYARKRKGISLIVVAMELFVWWW